MQAALPVRLGMVVWALKGFAIVEARARVHASDRCRRGAPGTFKAYAQISDGISDGTFVIE